ncbi:MAG: hypothetical protein ACKVS9_02785 [Phycisphaerae bacterium]
MSDRDPSSAPINEPPASGNGDAAPTDEAVGVRSLIDELKARVAEISAHELDLQRRENELEESRTQLESARSSETIEQLRRIRRKLAVARDELQRRETAIAAREREISSAPQTAPTSLADIDRLKAMEAAITARRDDVDRLYQQASEVAAGAQRRNAESMRMREEIEARDVELRRIEVQLAAERSEISRLSASATPTATRDPNGEFVGDTTSVRTSAPPWIAAAGSAVAVFAVALALQPTVYQSTGRLVIDSQRDDATSVTIEHAAILGDPAQLRTRLPDDLATLWADLVSRGAASVRAIPSPPAVELTLRGDDSDSSAAIIARIIGAYTRHVAEVPADRWSFRRLDQWRERVVATERQLAEANASLAGVTQQLQSQTGYAEWEENRAALAQARAGFATLTDDVRRLSGEISTLVDGPVPRGSVSDDELAAALRSDPAYREDAKEFAAEFRKYRVETAVAMVVASEPLGLLRIELQQLESSLVEQRDMQPPQNVREQIEQTLSELTGVASLTAAAVQGWEQRREQVERIDSPDRAAELLTLQAECVEQANRLTGALRDFARVVGKRLDQLSADGQGGTRALVVASLLRGHLSALTERTDVVAKAMSEVDASANTRLDVADRQVRGLRARLSDQKSTTQVRLLEDADRRAAAEHQSRIEGLKADLAAAEKRRDQAARELSERLDLVDRLETSTRDVRALAADRDRLETAVCDAEDELATLRAAQPTAQPDVIRAAASNVTRIAGASRFSVASLLSLIAAVATLGVPLVSRQLRTLLAARNRPARSR